MYPKETIGKSCAIIYTDKNLCSIINPIIWGEIKEKNKASWIKKFNDFSFFFKMLHRYILGNEAERLPFGKEDTVTLYRGARRFASAYLNFFENAKAKEKGAYHNAFFSASRSLEVFLSLFCFCTFFSYFFYFPCFFSR